MTPDISPISHHPRLPSLFLGEKMSSSPWLDLKIQSNEKYEFRAKVLDHSLPSVSKGKLNPRTMEHHRKEERKFLYPLNTYLCGASTGPGSETKSLLLGFAPSTRFLWKHPCNPSKLPPLLNGMAFLQGVLRRPHSSSRCPSLHSVPQLPLSAPPPNPPRDYSSVILLFHFSVPDDCFL